MKISIAVVVLSCALAAPAGANISILDNHKTVEVDCAKDPEIILVGNHITVTTKGVCTKILITGNHETVTGSVVAIDVLGNNNTITLAAADDVRITGNKNTVSVRAAVKRKAPRIANTGNDNKIQQAK